MVQEGRGLCHQRTSPSSSTETLGELLQVSEPAFPYLVNVKAATYPSHSGARGHCFLGRKRAEQLWFPAPENRPGRVACGDRSS